jgi:hypothetical protein
LDQSDNQRINKEERGYGSIDKIACINCVGDVALKQFIVTMGFQGQCNYCNCADICISVEDLLGEIMNGIRLEYDEVDNDMGWEDGEYVGAKTWDTYDLLYDELNWEMQLCDNLLDDINQIMKMTTWCESDPYQQRKRKERVSMWNAFCRMVKTKTRYVFFRMPEQDQYQEEAAFLILDHIGDEVDSLNLINKIPKGTTFYRGRMHNSTVKLVAAKDLCSPPHNKAKSNRMSAEGISIFYGANDEKTAITEIYDSRYMYATVAPFKNINELTVLDLTKIEDIPFPSLFDRENRIYREAILFLRELNDNLTRPIEYLESIEYIPAQIVAEYFRFIFTQDGQPIDGIVYRSSKVTEGICYALFFDYEQCLEKDNSKPLKGEQKMKLDELNINTYRVSTDIRFDEIEL